MRSRRSRSHRSTGGRSWPRCSRRRKPSGSTAITPASSRRSRRSSTPIAARGSPPPPARSGDAEAPGHPLLDPARKDAAASEAHRTPWRLLALLIAMAGVSAASPSLSPVAPRPPGRALTSPADPARVQLGVSLYLMGLAAAQLVFGPLSDRFGRRPVVLAGLALATIASTAAIFAASIASLVS